MKLVYFKKNVEYMSSYFNQKWCENEVNVNTIYCKHLR